MSGMSNNYYFHKGRVALYAILRAMGIGPGDEVIMPGFTCVVVPNAVMYTGAIPVYADIDRTTFNMNPDAINGKVTERTRAIIAQHTFGIPADMEKIMAIARDRGLFVIEDSCHAIGSRTGDREVGGIGHAAFFSSQWSKPVTTGLGGWASVNDAELASRMDDVYSSFSSPGVSESAMLMAQYIAYRVFFRPSLFWFAQGLYRNLSEKGITVGSSDECELRSVKPEGFEKTLSGWQRRLLQRKLREVSGIIGHRKMIASIYEDAFKNAGVPTPRLHEGAEPVYLRYPVVVAEKWVALKEARMLKLEVGDWFVSPVHPNTEGWERVHYRKGACPESEHVCEHIINLPTHKGIKAHDAERYVEFALRHSRGYKR